MGILWFESAYSALRLWRVRLDLFEDSSGPVEREKFTLSQHRRRKDRCMCFDDTNQIDSKQRASCATASVVRRAKLRSPINRATMSLATSTPTAESRPFAA
jgi:hypothetical protein